jgi:hypothetical protein
LNRQDINQRRSAVGFSVVGSLITILFFIYVNYSTGSRFPWFIYPTFAVIWWPLGVIFAGRHAGKTFSLAGSLAVIVLLFITNYLTSWNFPWFVFPSFAVIWWPLGVIFAERHDRKAFSLAGSLAVIALLFVTNYLTSWSHPWFLYPSFAVIWWPLAVFFGAKHGKTLSVIGCLSIIAFSLTVNLITSPSFLWFTYPAFAVIWWPLSVFLTKPRTARLYSVFGALFILAFLATDNLIHSPACPWMLLTVFPVLLWPASVFLGGDLRRLQAAGILCAVGIAYYVMLNLLIFPGFPWAVFPAYALLWWPLGAALSGRGHAMLFSLCGALISAALLVWLNIVASPRTIWAVYPVFALAWWPLSVYYFIYKPRKSIT